MTQNKKKSWWQKRIAEPSTWAGFGIFTAGLGTLLKAKGVPEAGQALAQNADQMAAGDYIAPIALILSGLAAALKQEGK